MSKSCKNCNNWNDTAKIFKCRKCSYLSYWQPLPEKPEPEETCENCSKPCKGFMVPVVGNKIHKDLFCAYWMESEPEPAKTSRNWPPVIVPEPEPAQEVCVWKKVDRDEFDKLVCIVGCTGRGRSNSDFTFCPDCGKPIREVK